MGPNSLMVVYVDPLGLSSEAGYEIPRGQGLRLGEI